MSGPRPSLAAVRERLVREGISSAGSALHASFEEEKRRGAVMGFELCLDLATPEQYESVIALLNGECEAMRNQLRPAGEVREKRWEVLQVELVFEVLKVHWDMSTRSARAVARYTAVSGAISEAARRGRNGG